MAALEIPGNGDTGNHISEEHILKTLDTLEDPLQKVCRFAESYRQRRFNISNYKDVRELQVAALGMREPTTASKRRQFDNLTNKSYSNVDERSNVDMLTRPGQSFIDNWSIFDRVVLSKS